VNVTAHRRGFLRRAGATIALAVIAGAMVGTPAFADDEIQGIGAANLTVGGGPTQVVVTIKNNDNAPTAPNSVTIGIPLTDLGVGIGNVTPNSACKKSVG